MSESENTPTPPPPSTQKTAAVPLKKETVRITLRSRPGAGATQPREATSPVSPVSMGAMPPPDISPKRSTAPIQLPSAPLPPPAPRSATAPVKLPPAPMDVRRTTSAVPVASSPAPSAPAPSMMPPPMGAPRPPGAPPAATVPMAAPRPPSAPGAPMPPSAPGAPRPAGPSAAPGSPPRVEAGAVTASLAKTVPVRPAVSAPRAPGAPGGAAPLAAAGPGAGTGALPKATVKLQQTQPMSRPSISAPPSAPVKRTAAADSQQFYEETAVEEGLVPLSVVCLLFSVVLLVVQMFGSDRVSASTDSPIMVPPSVPVKWQVPQADGNLSNDFVSKFLPALPE